MARVSVFLFCLSLVVFFSPTTVTADSVGVCYGRVADNLPPPGIVVRLLKDNGISKVRLFNNAPSVLKAFAGTGIKLMIGVPNEELSILNTKEAALEWLNNNVFAYVPPDQVLSLAVGNEILLKQPYYAPYLLPAMTNLHEALQSLTLGGRIKISTPHAASVLSTSYPPSASTFDPEIMATMRQLLKFLDDTEAPFMVNLYPFFSYVANPANVPLEFAVFGVATPVHDGELTYENQFDASVDGFVAALEKEGFGNIPVAVTETGWPTAGGAGAGKAEAEAYNGCIVRRVQNGVGTPRRPNVGVEVFLFDLYDENQKDGSEYERHFGIFGVDGKRAYSIRFGYA
ncbi:glucan endo-1,3-beta-glucosidase-like [Aristolochia californica]|uniref:glucan endo-1,3-beta-glucosidase-like n=1 Tax=Aristolochia californica TaxID=171875 RepID=UPI0035DB7F3F